MVENKQWRVIAEGQAYTCSVCEQRSTEECFVQEFGRITCPTCIDAIRFSLVENGQLTTAIRGSSSRTYFMRA